MKIALLLTPRQARKLLVLLHRETRRAQRAYEKSTFIPAPGHMHSDFVRKEVYSEIGEILERELDALYLKEELSK